MFLSLLLFPHFLSYIFCSCRLPSPRVPIAALPQRRAAPTAVPCSLRQQSQQYLKTLWMFRREYLGSPSIFKHPEELSAAVMSGTAVCSGSRLGQSTQCPWSCPWKGQHPASDLLTWVSPNPLQPKQTSSADIYCFNCFSCSGWLWPQRAGEGLREQLTGRWERR